MIESITHTIALQSCDAVTDCLDRFDTCSYWSKTNDYMCHVCWPELMRCLSPISYGCYNAQHVKDSCRYNYGCTAAQCALNPPSSTTGQNQLSSEDIKAMTVGWVLVALLLLTAVVVITKVWCVQKRQKRADIGSPDPENQSEQEELI